MFDDIIAALSPPLCHHNKHYGALVDQALESYKLKASELSNCKN